MSKDKFNAQMPQATERITLLLKPNLNWTGVVSIKSTHHCISNGSQSEAMCALAFGLCAFISVFGLVSVLVILIIRRNSL